MPVTLVEDELPAHAVDSAASQTSPEDEEATGEINHGAGPSNVLIVTNLTKDILNNPADIELLRSAFEDADIVERITPYPAIGRMRVVFRTTEGAVLARRLMDNSEWDCETVKIYFLKPERIERPGDAPDYEPQGGSSHMQYLEVPHVDNMHLLSPPPSPPVGWEHNVEPIPTVDQALISALAGLKANEETEILPARSGMPAIVVLACEDVDADPEYRRRALAGLKANEETEILPARSGMPAIVVLACEDVDVDPEYRRRAIAHREELSRRLGQGLGPELPVKKGDKPPRTPRPPMRAC